MTLTAIGGFMKPFNVLISLGSSTNNAYSAAMSPGSAASKSFMQSSLIALASFTATETIASSSPIEAFKTSAISFSLLTITIFFSVSSLATINLGYISIS